MAAEQTVTREVTLEEALSIAIQYQRHGQLADADDVFRKILEVAPDHPGVLHFAGVLAHQQGRSEEGLARVDRSLALAPDQADGHNNRGIILKALRRFDEAAEAYRRAIALNPGHANAHSNLGVVLRAGNQPAEAERAYRAAIAIDPDHADAYHNLGVLLAANGRTGEAVECLCEAVTLRPRHPETRRLLARAYCTLGEVDKAVEIYEQWLRDEPGDPMATHLLAAATGRDVPPRAADAYIEQAFDDFASSFDGKLASLSYQAPAIIAALVADVGLQPDHTLDVLDVGCGTGLCGPLVAPYAKRLVGVDLSAKMLEQAAAKQVYDELAKAELTAYLSGISRGCDLIVSADTLVYFGPLDAVINAAAEALRPGGHLLFTVEALAPVVVGDAVLQLHGRYAHSQAYLQRVLTTAGFQVSIVAVELRMEGGTPVAGFAVRARRIDEARCG